MNFDIIERDEGDPVGTARDTARDGFETTEEFARFLRHAARLEQASGDARSLRTWLDLAEAWRITEALRDCRGNRSAAARVLGIGRRTLYAKMDKLGIAPTWTL